jgi:hypothetical protein
MKRLTSILILVSAAVAASGTLSARRPQNNTPADKHLAGAVYTMSNHLAGNEIIVFDRSTDGVLTRAAAYPTGGPGSGGGLGNQGALALSASERWLLAVNPGSNDLSVFSVESRGLRLTDRRPSGGVQLISVAVHDHLVYVLNEGGYGSISGFQLGRDGTLSPLAGSIQPLSAPGVDPAQVAFDPQGEILIVTEKDTDHIVAYPVGKDGVAGPPVVHPSAGSTPAGFAFGKRGQLFVSEAAGGGPGAGTVSSYWLLEASTLEIVTPSESGQASALCWLERRMAASPTPLTPAATTFPSSKSGSMARLN